MLDPRAPEAHQRPTELFQAMDRIMFQTRISNSLKHKTPRADCKMCLRVDNFQLGLAEHGFYCPSWSRSSLLTNLAKGLPTASRLKPHL